MRVFPKYDGSGTTLLPTFYAIDWWLADSFCEPSKEEPVWPCSIRRRFFLDPPNGFVRTDDTVCLLQFLMGAISNKRVSVLINDTQLFQLNRGNTPLQYRRNQLPTGPADGQCAPQLLSWLVRPSRKLWLLKRVEKAGLGDLLAQFGGLDGPVSEGGRLISAAHSISFVVLQTEVQRPGWIIVAAKSGELSEYPSAYTDGV